jgi:hypothetical protein
MNRILPHHAYTVLLLPPPILICILLQSLSHSGHSDAVSDKHVLTSSNQYLSWVT